jgi:ATP-dependent Clp protease protease subunit
MIPERIGRQKKNHDGILYLFGEVNINSTASLIRDVININQKQEVDFIQLLINSYGGSASAGWALIDIMNWSRIPIYTTGLGMIASMGLMVFMAGHKGRRVLTPRTSILSHRYAHMKSGSHSDLIAWRKEEDLQYNRLIAHYLEYSTLKDRKEVEEKLLRESDTWLSAEEAIEYGIADRIEGCPLKVLHEK